jgi:hypothetical protein
MADITNKTSRKDAQGISASRRKLLRASAAAPFVATLHSGAAMANASALQCLINNVENPPTNLISDTIDTVMREEVSAGTSNGTPIYYVNFQWRDAANNIYGKEESGSDVANFLSSGRVYVAKYYTVNNPSKPGSCEVIDTGTLYPQPMGNNVALHATCLQTSIVVSSSCEIS